MTAARVDILVVTDPRFSGGTAASLVSDVEVFVRLGARVGLLCIESGFFKAAPDRPNTRILALLDLPGVVRVDGPVSAGIAFLHHPLAFFHGVRNPVEIQSSHAVLVTHHPPFRGDGSLEYDPLKTTRRIRRDFGCAVLWAPVSGLIRAQLRSFSPFLRMTRDDWVNTFDGDAWQPRHPVFSGGRAVVGRHGRSDILKWPERPDDVLAPLSPGPGWRTRVMGCPPELQEKLGSGAQNWELVPFNGESVPDFLESLDAFVYFHHARWVEAFGRTVAEAILMERPCILDPHLAPTFGELGYFCQPQEAPDLLRRLREDPAGTRSRASAARREAIRQYDTAKIESRLERLYADPGTRSRLGPKTASVPVALRKLAGLARRRVAGTI